uniref:MBD domain-containing protein n=1 Tax=Haptolina ericina TaxID=156174 RepID=A0A7S3F3C2_9EUKA
MHDAKFDAYLAEESSDDESYRSGAPGARSDDDDDDDDDHDGDDDGDTGGGVGIGDGASSDGGGSDYGGRNKSRKQGVGGGGGGKRGRPAGARNEGSKDEKKPRGQPRGGPQGEKPPAPRSEVLVKEMKEEWLVSYTQETISKAASVNRAMFSKWLNHRLESVKSTTTVETKLQAWVAETRGKQERGEATVLPESHRGKPRQPRTWMPKESTRAGGSYEGEGATADAAPLHGSPAVAPRSGERCQRTADLPPGWTQIECTSNTGKVYKRYLSPAGSKAQSVSEAWRVHEKGGGVTDTTGCDAPETDAEEPPPVTSGSPSSERKRKGAPVDVLEAEADDEVAPADGDEESAKESMKSSSKRKKTKRKKKLMLDVGSPARICQGKHQGKSCVVVGGHAGYLQVRLGDGSALNVRQSQVESQVENDGADDDAADDAADGEVIVVDQ